MQRSGISLMSEKDPVEEELAQINARLQTVISVMKTKHTKRSLHESMDAARAGLGVQDRTFVSLDGTWVEGTRHLDSLLKLSALMELQADMRDPGRAVAECTRLLERKIELLGVKK